MIKFWYYYSLVSVRFENNLVKIYILKNFVSFVISQDISMNVWPISTREFAKFKDFS